MTIAIAKSIDFFFVIVILKQKCFTFGKKIQLFTVNCFTFVYELDFVVKRWERIGVQCEWVVCHSVANFSIYFSFWIVYFTIINHFSSIHLKKKIPVGLIIVTCPKNSEKNMRKQNKRISLTYFLLDKRKCFHCIFDFFIDSVRDFRGFKSFV